MISGHVCRAKDRILPLMQNNLLISVYQSRMPGKNLLYWNVKELRSTNIGNRNENWKKCLLLTTTIKDVIKLWIAHMAINHLIRKVLKVLKNASSNFIQMLLSGHYLYAHGATKHGFEKVFLCKRTPRFQHKVKDFTAHILYLLKMKSGFVILGSMH